MHIQYRGYREGANDPRNKSTIKRKAPTQEQQAKAELARVEKELARMAKVKAEQEAKAERKRKLLSDNPALAIALGII
jgi:phosphoglycerol transferase MdoB-like AlkP superfamily enzyme